MFKLLKKEVLHWKSFLLITVVTILYVAFPVYAINYRYTLALLTDNENILQKGIFILQMLEALGTAFTRIDVVLMVVTGLLVGINIVLLVKTVKRLKQLKTSVKFMVGGSGALGLFSSGCASCGVSLASMFGVGTGFGFIPYGNNTLYILAIGISLYSTYYMIKQLDKSNYCLLKEK